MARKIQDQLFRSRSLQIVLLFDILRRQKVCVPLAHIFELDLFSARRVTCIVVSAMFLVFMVVQKIKNQWNKINIPFEKLNWKAR